MPVAIIAALVVMILALLYVAFDHSRDAKPVPAAIHDAR
jgi:hypothetical protein